MNEICNCACHKNRNVMHFMPCCNVCPNCGQNINLIMFKDHVKKCELEKNFENKKENS